MHCLPVQLNMPSGQLNIAILSCLELRVVTCCVHRMWGAKSCGLSKVLNLIDFVKSSDWRESQSRLGLETEVYETLGLM